MRFLLFCFFACIGFNMEAQVGINTTSPQAQLDIRSSNQAMPSNTDGILIPKIDAFPVTNPTATQTGMMVYLTTVSGANQPGFYYWDNPTTAWLPVSKNDDDWYEVGTSTPPNAITDNMFHTGNVAIGKATTTAKLDIEQTNSNIYAVRVRHTNPPNVASSFALDTEISSNQASGVISGVNNRIEPNNGVQGIGVYNNIQGTTSGALYGFRNVFANTGSGLKYGFTNSFDAGTGGSYGLYNSFNQTSTVSLRGVYNGFNNTAGTGNFVGVENFFSGSGSGAALIGTSSSFLTTSNSNIIGMSSNIPNANTGTGPKYGVYSVIESAAGGTHYGIFSQAQKSTGYAGYFLGRVSVGTTAGNSYILPLTRGTVNQIMQTDGVGNVTWQDPNSALNNFAWTTTGNSGLNASTHFIGTTDSVDLVFKAYNSPSGRIGVFNTAFGLNSQINNTGDSNTSYGSNALYNPSGNSNTAIGSGAMNWINTGSNNTSIGTRSLFNVRAGSENVALGDFAMFFNQDGNRNIAIGSYALQANVSGVRNIAIGYNAGFSETGSDKLYIENSNSTTPLIYGEFNNDLFRLNSRKFLVNDPVVNGIQMILKNRSRYVHAVDANLNFGTAGGDFLMATDESNSETAGIRGDGDNVSIWSPGDGNRQLRILDEDLWNDNDGNPYNNGAERAYIDAFGQYFQVSDKHQKENIQKIGNALNKVNQISGYTYQFKSDVTAIEKGEKQLVASGLLAQELELILPESVSKNEFGEYHVNYSAVVPLLVEALKEQQEIIEKMQLKIQELDLKVTTLNKN